VLWLDNNKKHKRRQLDADIYFKSLEKGQPLPADLFADQKNDNKFNKPLNAGIILISISIGITVFLWIFFKAISQKNPEAGNLSWFASAGLVPFMAGVASVIIHFIEKKKDGGEDAK
jgi:hypothetical protein